MSSSPVDSSRTAAASDRSSLFTFCKPMCPLKRGHLCSEICGFCSDHAVGAEAGKRVVVQIEDFAQDVGGMFA